MISFSDQIFLDLHPRQAGLSSNVVVGAKLARSQSTTEFTPLEEDNVVEYLFASDASAIIEHTNRVIFLEDDDVASVSDGRKLLSSKLLLSKTLQISLLYTCLYRTFLLLFRPISVFITLISTISFKNVIKEFYASQRTFCYKS